MQSFMKMKKKVGMTESTRQVLNKAIDLLHRVSNKKLSEEAARRELATALSTHFLAEGGVEEEKKIKLQVVLEEASNVVSQLEKGKIPLYEAIMMVNRIVVSENFPKKEEGNKIEPIQFRTKVDPYEDTAFVSQEFDVSGDQKEKNLESRVVNKPEFVLQEEKVTQQVELKEITDDIALLMNRVLKNKKVLEESISVLNGSLHPIGFELRILDK